jgi:uridine kinase
LLHDVGETVLGQTTLANCILDPFSGVQVAYLSHDRYYIELINHVPFYWSALQLLLA